MTAIQVVDLYGTDYECFDFVVNALVSHAYMTSGLSAYVNGTLPSRSDKIGLGGNPKVSNMAISYKPYFLLKPIFENSWPSRLRLYKHNPPENRDINSHPNIPSSKRIEGIGRATGHNFMASYVAFFEKIKPRIREMYGRNPNEWPELFNFGRLIRNAFSHNGVINIENRNAPTVKWKTLAYGPNDNGTSIMFNHMGTVEVILLMLEMDQGIGS